MAIRHWKQDPETGEMIPAEEHHAKYGHRRTLARSRIIGDMPDFVSPIDGTIVNGRKGWREMCRRHDVTHYSDFTQEWKQKAQQREAVAEGRCAKTREERKRDIAKAMEICNG